MALFWTFSTNTNDKTCHSFCLLLPVSYHIFNSTFLTLYQHFHSVGQFNKRRDWRVTLMQFDQLVWGLTFMNMKHVCTRGKRMSFCCCIHQHNYQCGIITMIEVLHWIRSNDSFFMLDFNVFHPPCSKLSDCYTWLLLELTQSLRNAWGLSSLVKKCEGILVCHGYAIDVNGFDEFSSDLQKRRCILSVACWKKFYNLTNLIYTSLCYPFFVFVGGFFCND